MTKEQKHELIEAGVVVVAAVVLFLLFHRGSGGTTPLLTPTSQDLTPFGSSGGIPSLTLNYPGSPYNDPGLPPSPADPNVSLTMGGTSIGGNTLTGGNNTGSPITFGNGATLGGSPTDIGATTLDAGGLPAITFPGILGPGTPITSDCGCCNNPPANGDAFPTPQAAIDYMSQALPRVPQIRTENPYGFALTTGAGETIPANSVLTDTGQVMTLAQYNQLTDSLNLAAENPGTNEQPSPPSLQSSGAFLVGAFGGLMR